MKCLNETKIKHWCSWFNHDKQVKTGSSECQQHERDGEWVGSSGRGCDSTAMVAFEGQKGKLRERTRLTVAESQWGPRERTFSL